MSKLKVPFTPFQLGLSLLCGAGLIFCVGGDLVLLMFDRGTVSRGMVTINLTLALLTMAVCGALILRAGEIDLFDEGESGDRTPAVVALRTYFCMIAADITGVLMLMLAGALVWNDAGRAIMVYAPLMFAAAGGLYYWRIGRMGVGETDETAQSARESEINEEIPLEQAMIVEMTREEAVMAETVGEETARVGSIEDLTADVGIFDELLERIACLSSETDNDKDRAAELSAHEDKE